MTTKRVSAKEQAQRAAVMDAAYREVVAQGQPVMAKKGQPTLDAATVDSFVNFAQKMGVGADNPLSSSTYGFNPITKNRLLLEWIHRGSWLGGVAVDVVADDMTRAGVYYTSEMAPDAQQRLDKTITKLNTWSTINEIIKWGRLYGGCIGVVLIDGQDPRTPLRMETVGPGSYKGLIALDRWMVEPSLEDLVQELGPHMGKPRYYRVTQAAPALRGMVVHHSRVAFRHVGVELPYQQSIVENGWGISVLERLFDRMIAFDSASTGAAQLVYKAYLRTLSVEGLRDVVAAGNAAMDGLIKYVENMRRFQSLEGISIIDAKDKIEVQGHSAFSGLGDILSQFALQLSGALQIPLVRLFGQSPGGLGSNGDSEMRTYYDSIAQRQQKDLDHGVHLVYQLAARSRSIELPPNFGLDFQSLWQMTDADKANISKTICDTVSSAFDSGLISQRVVLQELRQASRTTGIFTNITKELIDKADDEPQTPGADGLLGLGGLGGAPSAGEAGGSHDEVPERVAAGQLPTSKGVTNGSASGSQGQAGEVDEGSRRRAPLQLPAPQRRPTNRGAGQGTGTQGTASALN